MQYLSSGESLVLDQSLCNGCGRCTEVCPHAVFSVVDRKSVVIQRGNCMQCGACQMNCQAGAIQVSSGVGCVQAIVNSMRQGDSGDASCNCG